MPGTTCPPPPPPSQFREDGDLILILLNALEKIQDIGSYTLTLDDLPSDFSPSLATHTQKKSWFQSGMLCLSNFPDKGNQYGRRCVCVYSSSNISLSVCFGHVITINK